MFFSNQMRVHKGGGYSLRRERIKVEKRKRRKIKSVWDVVNKSLKQQTGRKKKTKSPTVY